jgi:glutamate carboxypeptidase
MKTLSSDLILEAVRQWVVLESPTHDHAAVNRVADHAEAVLRDAGATIERISGGHQAADILIGRIAGQKDGPGLLVLGHMDTVHPVGTLSSNLAWRIEGDRACDCAVRLGPSPCKRAQADVAGHSHVHPG